MNTYYCHMINGLYTPCSSVMILRFLIRPIICLIAMSYVLTSMDDKNEEIVVSNTITQKEKRFGK